MLFSENPKNQAINCQIIFFFPSFYITSGIGLALYVHVFKVVTRIALVQEGGRIVLEEDSIILGQTSNQNTKAASLMPQFLPSLPSELAPRGVLFAKETKQNCVGQGVEVMHKLSLVN